MIITDYDPKQATLLTSTEGRVLTKTHTPDGPRAYDKAYLYRSEIVEFGTLPEILDTLRMIEDMPHSCLIRGEKMEQDLSGLDPYTRAAMPTNYNEVTPRNLENFADVPRAWVMLDIDDVTWSEVGVSAPTFGPEDAKRVWDHLTRGIPSLRNTGFVYQWSGSAGFSDHAKVHFFVVLDQPRDQAYWREVANALCAPRVSIDGKVSFRNGTGEFVFDVATTRTTQPHYLAAPLFEGVSDPLEGVARCGVVPGPDFDTKRLDAALRRIYGTPRLVVVDPNSDAPKIRNRHTGQITRSCTSARDLDLENLCEKLPAPDPAMKGYALRSLEYALDTLRTCPKGSMNDTRFFVANTLVPKTPALELLGLDGLVSALADAMVANPHSTLSRHSYEVEFRRVLAYGYAGYTPRKLTKDALISAHTPVTVTGRYILPTHLSAPTPVVALRSPMGTGKSTAIGAHLAANPDAPVRAVAPRRALVRAMAQAWGLVHYTEDSADRAKRLATTLHSLWKATPVDGQILVIDEAEQSLEVLTHEVDAGLQAQAYDALLAHVRAASQIILADAHLGYKTQRLIELAGIDPEDVTLVVNPWRPANRAIEVLTGANEAWNETEAEGMNILMGAIPDAIRTGAPVFVACTARAIAERTALAVESKHPTARTILITQKTVSEPHVQAFMTEPNAHANLYDVIIASPSVQSGVSIDVPVSLAIIFARSGDWTTPTLAVQQLGRARNPARSVWVGDTTGHNFETDPDVLASRWDAARAAVFGPVYGFNSEGKCEIDRYMRADLYHATADMEAHANAQRNEGMSLVLSTLRNHEGYKVTRVSVDREDFKHEDKDARNERKAARERAQLAEAAQIFATPCPTPDETLALVDKHDLTIDEQRALTHGLVAMALDDAPTLADLEHNETKRGVLRKGRGLALFMLDSEVFDARIAHEAALAHNDHTTVARLHESKLVQVQALRKIVDTTGFGFMLDASADEDARTYNPSEFWTQERTQAVADILADHGIAPGGKEKVHTVVHRMVANLTGITFTRHEKRDNSGKKYPVYTATQRALDDAMRWARGYTKRMKQEHDQRVEEVASMAFDLVVGGGSSFSFVAVPVEEEGTPAQRILQNAKKKNTRHKKTS